MRPVTKIKDKEDKGADGYPMRRHSDVGLDGMEGTYRSVDECRTRRRAMLIDLRANKRPSGVSGRAQLPATH